MHIPTLHTINAGMCSYICATFEVLTAVIR